MNLPSSLLSEQKGIAPTTPALLRRFGISTKTLLDSYEDQADELPKSAFNPKDIKDARKKVFVAIRQRQGQPAFRRALFKAYNSRCAITGSRTKQVLEAAHITPYRGAKTNAVVNGLLLRADVHTLFDLGLISIEPNDRKIRVSELLANSLYAKLAGKKLAAPKAHSSKPSRAALEEHFSQFQP